MTDYSLLWAVVLLLLSIALVVMEAFIPSWGVLGTCALISALAGIGLAFYSDPLHGVIVLGVALIVFPVLLYIGVKWWPDTPIGRRILLRVPSRQDVVPDNPKIRELRALMGKVGQAKSVMLPSGPVVIDGRTYDAVSEGLAIEEGQLVRVVEVRGNRVVVRAIDEQLDQPSPAEGNDLLSQPIESLGLEGFEDEEEEERPA